MGVDIREFDGRYESAILDMHKRAFGLVDMKSYSEDTLTRVRDILQKGRSAIGVDGRRLVGFGLSASIDKMPERNGMSHKDHVNNWFGWAKVPGQSGQLENMLAKLRKHTVLVGTYSNPFIHSTNGVSKNDWYMDGVAVLPERRGEGIGRLLTEKRLEYAQDEGAAAVYATLHLAGRGIERLYTHLGFSPLLKITPAYPDGSAAKYVGKKL